MRLHLKRGDGFLRGNELAETDANGYYEILVPDNAVLVFKAGMNDPILERGEQPHEINVEISDGIMLGKCHGDGEAEGDSAGTESQPTHRESFLSV